MVKSSVITLVFLVVISCTMRLKPLLFERVDYHGNKIKIDGYYYHSRTIDNVLHTSAYFFYRNGVYYRWGWSKASNLEIFESKIRDQEYLQHMNNVPYGWGVYIVLRDKIQYSGWSTSVGGSYPAFKGEWEILNDTTLYDRKFDETWYFKEFSPKPDSTNRFVDAKTLRHKPIRKIN